jgi:hypothetical protein
MPIADADVWSGKRARERGAPAAADAIAFAGGLGVALGVLFLTVDLYAHDHGRAPGVALFVVLLAAGYLMLAFLPNPIHPAAVTLVVAAVPGAVGWWLLPGADRFADVRPFLVLTLLGWTACWIAPRTRGRTVFVGAALLLLWLWMIGEAAGTDAYSAAPIPSPPAHTTFSLSALHTEVTIDDLDPTDARYPIALLCNDGDGEACDTLYDQAEPGSDFEAFADTCGNTLPAGFAGQCADFGGDFGGQEPFDPVPPPFDPEIVPQVGAGSSDKSLEIGLVSLFFGLVYTGALFAFDRRRWHGLGTALVVPAFLALFTGTQVLGDAAEHAWTGGLLTLVAGVAFALVGDLGGRRFTTWAGGAFAAFGAYVFAGDVTNFEKSFSELEPNLARPAWITIASGVALIVLAFLVAALRSRYPDGESPPAPEPPPFEDGFAPIVHPPAPPWEPPSGA